MRPSDLKEGRVCIYKDSLGYLDLDRLFEESVDERINAKSIFKVLDEDFLQLEGFNALVQGPTKVGTQKLSFVADILKVAFGEKIETYPPEVRALMHHFVTRAKAIEELPVPNTIKLSA